ncbi:MAG: N-acetylneuraminate synthase [FCB group bacterium]|nr:N-acetylneuraminate synthase [FCB group bacterium]
MRTIKIGDRIIGDDHPALVIAEIGINHQGDIEIAKQLIQQAQICGADAVKFQKRTISRILTRAGLDALYDNPNSFGRTYEEHKIALELSERDYAELQQLANDLGLMFIASGWDEQSIDFLDELGVPFFKMASADLTNHPLLEYTAKKGKAMVLSTGMADLTMVREAYALVSEYSDQIAILQCTSTYPSSFEEINLNVIKTYLEEFPNAVIGYSGHELGIAIPPVAVALGARIIERHFTLDRTMKGGDHAASLEPPGFSKMVRDIHHVELAMGVGDKQVQESEKPIFVKLAKSLVSLVEIKKGEIITREMLTTKGPGTGISPVKMDLVVGKKALKNVPADTVLKNDDIDWAS